MQKPKGAVGIVVLFALIAVVMAVVSVKMSPLDKSNAAFVVQEPYLRSSLPTSTSAAAFMMLRNDTGRDDRLVAVRSGLSGRVELHTHTQDANGVVRMGPIEGGVALPDGTTHAFKRGGDHLMFIGLDAPLSQGQMVQVTLVFEKAGEVEISVPVDLDR
ncbi:copper chaperone PCu(A)C [Sulfitobacter sp. F26169L]|uniref:copper chaperone PCu(A)C n=1 Tax=Sulfitobacter sp. F26169L TaxID=2996015 RepID=UPI002260BEEC|nr:copper chaperone PCu(A)C [Sulfitobacter sp. F26169L]MCX7567166.1 copper chaperone PCu(A)C [Sulfitobacter sp. F26169L]